MKRFLTFILLMAFVLTAATPAEAGSTLLALRTKLRTMLYDTLSDSYLYADATLNDALFTAERTLIDMTPKSVHAALITKTTTAGVVGQNYFNVTDLPRTLFSVAWGGEPAIQIKLEEYFTAKTQATWNDPMFCYRAGTDGVTLILEVFPICSSTTQELELIGLKEPTYPSGDSSTMEVSTRYDDLLLSLAAYEMLMNDNQSARAATFEKKIASYVTILNNQRNNQGVIEPPIVTTGGQK